MKKYLIGLTSVSLAVVLLLTTAVSAFGLEYKSMSRQTGVSASATWTWETSGSPVRPAMEVSLFLSASQDRDQDTTNVYVRVERYFSTNHSAVHPPHVGNVLVNASAFATDGKLDVASLSAVTVNLYDEPSDKTTLNPTPPVAETIVISADWVGFGDLNTQNNTTRQATGDYSSKNRIDVRYRQATASGTGTSTGPGGTAPLPLRPTTRATLSSFHNSSMQMEK